MNKGPLGFERPSTQQAKVSPAQRELYWIAGFLEGEGYFGESVSATQKEKQPVMRLLTLLGGALRRQGKYWRWSANGSRARGVMLTIFPLLSPRRQRAIRKALS